MRTRALRQALNSLALVLGLTTLGGCVVYEPVPVAAPQPSPQQRFERSWAAANDAMMDQGVTITSQDRGSGVIRGHRVGVPVTATVQTEADGSVQVSFETVGAAEKDPGLTQRLRESYLRRIGR
jgi:hypothetical protein